MEEETSPHVVSTCVWEDNNWIWSESLYFACDLSLEVRRGKNILIPIRNCRFGITFTYFLWVILNVIDLHIVYFSIQVSTCTLNWSVVENHGCWRNVSNPNAHSGSVVFFLYPTIIVGNMSWESRKSESQNFTSPQNDSWNKVLTVPEVNTGRRRVANESHVAPVVTSRLLVKFAGRLSLSWEMR